MTLTQKIYYKMAIALHKRVNYWDTISISKLIMKCQYDPELLKICVRDRGKLSVAKWIAKNSQILGRRKNIKKSLDKRLKSLCASSY